MGARWSTALVVVLALVSAGCASLVAPRSAATSAADSAAASASPATANEAAGAWSSVLARFVDERGEVDFPALAQDRAELDRVVRYIADTPVESLPDGSARLAHFINAYNALSMFNVVDSGIPQTHAGWNKVNFFVLRRFNVGGRTVSLRGFENDLIRPYALARGDPRIHFALNCSAVACPVLPRVPFTAAHLDAELERETRAFFARSANFRVDTTTRTVWLSEILDFYPDDFVPLAAPSLLAYANRYAPAPAPADYLVRFTPYDWTVANSRRPRAPQAPD